VSAAAEIVVRLQKTLQVGGDPFVTGSTWTTDAPYRELYRDVIQHQQEGVKTVDMEALLFGRTAPQPAG
jgi:hypothetical protein